MQTFLPYQDYLQSALSLDKSRLGNQCYRECLTLYNGGWANHPASKMWSYHKREFCLYAAECARAMAIKGGWRNGVARKWLDFWLEESDKHPDIGKPPWLGVPAIHLSHQANLKRKDPEIYKFDVEPMNGYYWPRMLSATEYEIYFKHSN